jgi:DHA2 family multidrug resistance protein
LIAIGFAGLEVVLDRGQRDDWLESNFIATFLAVALIALVVAIIWELRQRDPVVELRLLSERNFAISNCFYFIFGFVLFGSTVLIPQMLQSLYGYTATDAGLVLGPGAAVIVIMAPVIVKLLPKIGARNLIITGFAILAFSMWMFSTYDLTADYRHEVWARVVQGFGISFLFVPTSQLAYSYLPREKNNKASSLTNLFRNQGGSFGIAFVTSMLERRTQFHQNVLVEHASNFDSGIRNFIAGSRQVFIANGSSPADASLKALGLLSRVLTEQAALLAFLDCFRLLGIMALAAIPLALMIKSFRIGGPAQGH